jgi:hypothetical protein
MPACQALEIYTCRLVRPIVWTCCHGEKAGGDAEPAKVFDIIVVGELLRGALEDTLVAKNVSTEGTVELEYTFLALPPQLDESIPQNDWFGASLLVGSICRSCRL